MRLGYMVIPSGPAEISAGPLLFLATAGMLMTQRQQAEVAGGELVGGDDLFSG